MYLLGNYKYLEEGSGGNIAEGVLCDRGRNSLVPGQYRVNGNNNK